MRLDIPVTRFRHRLGACLDHHRATGDRIVLTRHGRVVAALVSERDLEALEAVESGREEILAARQEADMREFRAMKAALR